MLFSRFAHRQEERPSLPTGIPTFPALACVPLREPSLPTVSKAEMETSYLLTQSPFTPGCCKVLSCGFFIFFPRVAASCIRTPKMPGLSRRLPDGYYTLNYNCTVREFSFLMPCQHVPFKKIISIEVSSLGRK